MSLFLSRTWAEIDLDKIKQNYKFIKSKLNPTTKFMAVVKADAYGHGAKVISRELQELGADWFAVSNIEEALQLRHFGIKRPILILGYTPVHLAKVLAENNISQTLLDEDYTKSLLQQAKHENIKIKVHVKIDTGMSRIGFYYHNFEDNKTIENISNLLKDNHFLNEGIFTHFASADLDNDEDGTSTKKQYDLFIDCIKKLHNKGIDFQLKHCCNSAATLEYTEYQLDMVRPGIIMYGLTPSKYFEKYDLKPSFVLKSIISLIKEIDKESAVSYGKTFISNKKMKIATIPVGYADGYSRNLSNKGFVLINGKKANIIGRVCMDQMMVDITDIGTVNIGDEVILFGDDNLTTNEYSSLCNTINYETVCLIGKRVPRVYFKNNIEQEVVNYIYHKKD